MIDSPIFLVGSERSGTTLLRLMLDHHPNIAFDHEFEYAVDWEGADEHWPDLQEYYTRLSTHRIYQARRYTIDDTLSYPDLVDSFLAQRRSSVGRSLVGATVHYRFDRITRIWPNARFIHLIRDGRDVARSTIQMGWAGNYWTAIEHWIAAEKTWENMQTALGSDRFINVRYEDLVRRPEEVLLAICQFVGVDYNPSMLKYPEDSTYSSPNPNLAEQWRSKLSEQEIRLVEARASDLLKKRGYDLSGLPPLSVDSRSQTEFLRQCKRYRRNFRINRFGLMLTSAEFLARRLKLRRLEKIARVRMNYIENMHIK